MKLKYGTDKEKKELEVYEKTHGYSTTSFIIETAIIQSKDEQYKKAKFDTLWKQKCDKCGSEDMILWEQPFFNVYHSQTFRVHCKECNNLVKELVISGSYS